MSLRRESIELAFREESGKILASLIRVLGDFDLAEDVLQDAFVKALTAWDESGVPDKPGAWITTAARRAALDRLRRSSRSEGEAQLLSAEANDEGRIEMIERKLDGASEDDRLRLIFTCCHPALHRDGQVGLTLKMLGGLTTEDIARAFLIPTSTMAQRLVRAKNKIRGAGIPYRIPSAKELPERIPAVLSVLYLVFNEGYSASAGEDLMRADLCREAIRLGRVLVELMGEEAEVLGLLALMLVSDSRRAARSNAAGEQILLDQQDRSLWDRAAIDEGLQLLRRASHSAQAGPYQLQAAISAEHARANTPDETDWAEIVRLYDRLLALHASPVVALNRAVAVAMHTGPDSGLKLVEELGGAGALDGYLFFHTTRAEFLHRVGRASEARDAYQRALTLAGNSSERTFIEGRLQQLDA